MADKCKTCGGVTEAQPVDTSLFPEGSLQPVADACTCASQSTSLTQQMNCPTTCPPKCPPQSCVSACEVDHTKETIINNLSATVKTTTAFNFPAVGAQAEVKLVNVQSLIPGQILWAQGIGRLHVVSWDFETRKAVLTNLGDSCTESAASAGELIPACTEFGVGIPECNGGSSVVTAGPFLAADMTAPGNGNCTTIKVTTITGIALNDIVSISTFLYRVDQVVDTETLVVCDDGDGAPLGQVIEWDANNDGVPDVPVLPISGDNPCSKAGIDSGVIVVCDGSGLLTKLVGSTTGQVPVWDEALQKHKHVALNLNDQCTFLTACFTVDIGDDGPYLVTVDDTSIFSVGQQVRIDGDLFTIDSIEDATHFRLIPETTPTAIKEYDEGELVCLRDCCEFLPEQVAPLLEDCFPDGILQYLGPAINNQVLSLTDITAGMTDRFFINPANDIAIESYTNNTLCRQVVECELEVAQSVILQPNLGSNNATAVSEFQLGTPADASSALPRAQAYFDSQGAAAGTPPADSFQGTLGWNWLNVHTSQMKRTEIVDPGNSVDFVARHRILFDSPNNPNPPDANVFYLVNWHGRVKATRLLP